MAPDTDNPDATIVPGSAPPVPPPADPVQQSGRQAKVVTMQRGTLAKQMRGERERGKQEALTAIEQKAKALGYASVDDMFAHQERQRQAANQRQQQPSSQQQTPAPPRDASSNEQRRYQRELEKQQKVFEDEKRARVAAERRRRQVEEEKRALEAEVELERTATRVGFRDADYAIHLYTRVCAGKSPDELARMDEEQFFKGLRDSHPYLFGEERLPANTATTPGQSPPKPREMMQRVVRSGKFDARTATKEELNAHYKKLGLTPPSGSLR